jgi:hypothetical protein
MQFDTIVLSLSENLCYHLCLFFFLLFDSLFMSSDVIHYNRYPVSFATAGTDVRIPADIDLPQLL